MVKLAGDRARGSCSVDVLSSAGEYDYRGETWYSDLP